MIDIHTHILPGADDGARDLDETMDMCRLCADDGVRVIAVTPHDLNGVYSNDRNSVIQHTAALKEEISKHGIPVEIVPGADVALSPDLLEKLDNGSIMTLNDTGKYILLEPPQFFMLDAFKRHIFEIKRRDIIPIITHPERNEILMTHHEALYDAVIGGALIQVTAASLTGEFGPQVRKRTIDLLTRNMVHFIASDSHNTKTRRPGLSRARTEAAVHVGQAEAARMVIERPEAALRGDEIVAAEPVQARKRHGLFSMFLPRKKSY
ncbi:MAG: hypothetical protein KAR83_10045 [Thermodesulfovibrionales bacterium]|nr:hypothetical protein [Thermodesulfovibrionales bacterium]